VGGEQQGHPKPLVEPGPHVTGIGVVGMNPVGQARSRQKALDQDLHQTIEVIPEILLGQITIRSEADSADGESRGDHLHRPRVIGGHLLITHQASDQLHPLDLRPSGQGAGQIEHIDGLATRIGIAPELQVMAAKQAMQMKMEQHQTHGNPWVNDSALDGFQPNAWLRGESGAGLDQMYLLRA